MTVVAIISVVAVTAMAGLSADNQRGRYRRFVQDLESSFVRARHMSIDRQTMTRVIIEDNKFTLEAQNLANGNWEKFMMTDMTTGSNQGGLDGKACVLAVEDGILAPASSTGRTYNAPPADCMTGVVTITYSPDGTFAPDAGVALSTGAGLSIWTADRSGNTDRHSLIQVYPGGLVRMFENIDPGV